MDILSHDHFLPSLPLTHSSKTGRVYKSGKDNKTNRSNRCESEKGREAANARERQRMNCINAGFDCLRKTLPKRGTSRRLSKAETLREAIQYIKKLHGSLIEERGKEEKEEEEEIEDNKDSSSMIPSFPWSIPSTPNSFSNFSSTPLMNSPSFAFSTMSLSSPSFPSRPYAIH